MILYTTHSKLSSSSDRGVLQKNYRYCVIRSPQYVWASTAAWAAGWASATFAPPRGLVRACCWVDEGQVTSLLHICLQAIAPNFAPATLSLLTVLRASVRYFAEALSQYLVNSEVGGASPCDAGTVRWCTGDVMTLVLLGLASALGIIIQPAALIRHISQAEEELLQLSHVARSCASYVERHQLEPRSTHGRRR
jgi:hypothetical protein